MKKRKDAALARQSSTTAKLRWVLNINILLLIYIMSKTNDPDYYTNLVNVRSINYDSITTALDIVKQFIISYDLVLVGGMAIDFALKLKGDQIYTDDQLPDYDFYSPVHTEHAYQLGAMLCKAGFPNISCIQAAHITTMRVRVDFETVADITYCPPEVYKRVPTLKYSNMRIIHPHFQMIDQHSSLSIPYENPGREVIFHRWIKDMKRYDKLYKHYPIVPDVKEDIISDDLIVTLEMETNEPKYKTEENKPNPVGGYPRDEPPRGYTRSPNRMQAAKELEIPLERVKVPMAQLSGGCLCGWGGVDYKIEGDYVSLLIPKGEPITVAAYDYKEFIDKHALTDIEYYSEYFGKIPRSIICPSKIPGRKLEIYDVFGIKISAKKISEKHDVYVCNIQWCMCYLLVKIFSSKDKTVVFTAEEQYVRCRQIVAGGEFPTIEVYGKYNFTHAFLNKRKKDKEKIYQIRAKNMQPPNMYPKPPECVNDKSFDPETSEYFKTDKRKLDYFTEWTIDPYPEYTTNSVKG